MQTDTLSDDKTVKNTLKSVSNHQGGQTLLGSHDHTPSRLYELVIIPM